MTHDLVADMQDVQMRLTELQTQLNEAMADADLERVLRLSRHIHDTIIEARKVVTLNYANEELITT